MKRTAATTESILIECDLPDPPEKVWRALTEQELLSKWLMPCDLRAEVGARFHFRPGSGEGKDTPIDCEVLDVEPHRLLRWLQTERDDSDARLPSVESVVTLQLLGIATGGTRLRLVHDGFTSVSSQIAESRSPKASATVLEFKAPTGCARGRRRGMLVSARSFALLRRAA